MKSARDIMTEHPATCTVDTPLGAVAKLMVQHNCGEIPVLDGARDLVGVVTDRDIVCRLVASGKNPLECTAEMAMTSPAISVRTDTPLDEVLAVMERHLIRRVPVLDDNDRCVGILGQADLAWAVSGKDVVKLVRDVSRDTDQPSR